MAKFRDTRVEGSQPLLVSAEAAAALCGRSSRTWRTWNATARIPRPIRFGRSTLWRIDEVRAWIAAGCPNREAWERSTERARLALSSVPDRGNS